MQNFLAPISILIVRTLLCNSVIAQTGAIPENDERCIRKVFDDIVTAVYAGGSAPRLVIRTSGMDQISNYEAGSRVVNVDVRLMELCRRLDDDSLNGVAAVLAHELAHDFRGHGNRNGTVKLSRAEKEGIKYLVQDKISWRAYEELQADYFAGFYGRAAGYDPLRVMPRMLGIIYQEFELEEEDSEYPSLRERKKIASQAAGNMNSLIQVFETANYCSLIRSYPEARKLYNHVAGEFLGREIFNNAGLASVLHALEFMGEGALGFIYPLEMDRDTRLRGVKVVNGRIERATRGTSPEDSALGARLLLDAAEQFNEAIEHDPRYSPALLNLATVRILQRDYEGAVRNAKSAMDADTSTLTRIYARTLIAISRARGDDHDEAVMVLQEISESASEYGAGDLIQANLAVLEHRDFTGLEETGSRPVVEQIGGLRAGDRIMSMPPVIRIDADDSLAVVVGNALDHDVIRVEHADSWIQFIFAGPDYSRGTSNGVRIGDSVQRVRHVYGNPSRTICSPRGQYHIYEYSKLIFLIDTSGNVANWAIYAIG